MAQQRRRTLLVLLSYLPLVLFRSCSGWAIWSTHRYHQRIQQQPSSSSSSSSSPWLTRLALSRGRDDARNVLFESTARSLNVSLPYAYNVDDNDDTSFSFLLNQLSARDPFQAGPQAAQIWRAEPVNDDISVKTWQLNKVLACFATSVRVHKSQPAAQRRLVNQAQALVDEATRDAVATPDRVTSNTLLSLWSKLGDYDRVQRMLEEEDLAPDAVSYGSLLHAYAVSGRARDARRLFEDVWSSSRNNTASSTKVMLPLRTTHPYHAVLTAYANARQPRQALQFYTKWKKRAARPAPSRQQQLPKPTVQSANIVLHALSTWSETERFFVQDMVYGRDAVSYTTLFASACRFLHTPQAINRVRRHWNWRLVDSAFLANVVYSLATLRGAAPYALSLVKQAKEEHGIALNVDAYNALLYCWSQQPLDDENVLSTVMDLLKEIKSDVDLGGANIKSYTNVLNALKGRGLEALFQAEALVASMESGELEIQPNVAAYTTLVQCYARSPLEDKATKAWKVATERMEERKQSPNTITYNAVLNACAFTATTEWSLSQNAVQIAVGILETMRKRKVVSNHVTYGTFLSVLIAHMPDSSSRDKLLRLVFRRACEEGQVSRFVIQKLRLAVGPEGRDILLAGHDAEYIPALWTRNVRETKARHDDV